MWLVCGFGLFIMAIGVALDQPLKAMLEE